MNVDMNMMYMYLSLFTYVAFCLGLAYISRKSNKNETDN